ncbi:UNKNOWN [Stylonychia lemnae]|uniref:Uncharacterized protein n=1 Tax=Stylonychia lemnae TaxID=5949 RepID=A0A078A389_STYLE|nr:UNKNOWN [Stylonychia lemnae]|eukprot:CDW75229.1 UNKNOWN [Stylonychia lemnae]
MPNAMNNYMQGGGFNQFTVHNTNINNINNNGYNQFYPAQQQVGYNISQDYQIQSLYNPYLQQAIKYPDVTSQGVKNGKNRAGGLKKQFIKRGNSRPQSAQMLKHLSHQKSSYQNLNTIPNNPMQNNFFKQQQAPRNIGTFEKEQLYEEAAGLRIERNKYQNENVLLRTQVKAIERLNQENYSQAQILQLQNAQSNTHLGLKYKLKIKQLKNDLLMKQEEIMNLNRTLKYTKLKEYEVEIEELQKEIGRLNQAIQFEISKPRIDPMAYQKLGEDLQRQQIIIKNTLDDQNKLNNIINDKDLVIQKRDRRINKQVERIKLLREKQKLQIKKIKLLTNKLMDCEKLNSVMLSKNSGQRGRNGNFNVNESVRTKRSNSGASPRGANSSPKRSMLNQADWFERYAIEKTQKEKLEIWIKKRDPNIDFDKIYQTEIEDENQSKELQSQITINFDDQQRTIEFTDNLDQIRAFIMNEFNLEQDKQFVLKNQNGDVIETQDQMKEQDMIVVELVEVQEEEQYEEEEFDEYVENLVDCVKYEDVQFTVLELRLKLQIKKVKRQNAFKYVMNSLKDEKGKRIKIVSLKQLQNQFYLRMKFDNNESLLLARYIMEQPNQNGQVAFNIQAQVPRSYLKKKFEEIVPNYIIYNGLAISSMLNRITTILDDYKSSIEDYLNDKDESESGEVHLKTFILSLKESNSPNLDDDIKDLLFYILLRQSTSLTKINYYAFLEIFDEDYLIQASPHEDQKDFEASSESSEDEKPIKSQNQTNSIVNQGSNSQKPQSQDIEVDEEDLMLSVDEILGKLVQQYRGQQKIMKQLFLDIRESLNNQAIDGSKQVYYIIQSDFSSFIRNRLNLPQDTQSEKQIQCLMHILIREELQGVILYDEFKALVSNYIKKEKVFQKSLQQGYRYDLINKDILDFFQHIKTLTQDNEEEQRQGKSLTNEILKKVIKNQTIQNKDGKQLKVQIVNFDDMLDHLFMAFTIRCPPMKVQFDLRQMLCIDPGLPDIILIKKLEKIIDDLDLNQANLLRIMKSPDYKAYITTLIPKSTSSINRQATHSKQALQQPKPQQQDNESASKKKPAPKKGVSFSNDNSNVDTKEKVQKKEDSDFKYDPYRKKFTVKPEEISDEDIDNYQEDDDKISSEQFPSSASSSFKDKKQKNQKEQEVKKQEPPKQVKKEDKKENDEKIKNKDKKEKISEKPKEKQQLKSDDIEDDDIKEEKMNFVYDPYRKKYTQKPEEISEEEDFIEDNYDFD